MYSREFSAVCNLILYQKPQQNPLCLNPFFAVVGLRGSVRVRTPPRVSGKKVEKGKGKCIYIALIFVVHSRRSGIDHTVLPAITPMPAFTS